MTYSIFIEKSAQKDRANIPRKDQNKTRSEKTMIAAYRTEQSYHGGFTVKDYHINIFYSEEDEGYIADVPDLKHCSAFGSTPEETLQ